MAPSMPRDRAKRRPFGGSCCIVCATLCAQTVRRRSRGGQECLRIVCAHECPHNFSRWCRTALKWSNDAAFKAADRGFLAKGRENMRGNVPKFILVAWASVVECFRANPRPISITFALTHVEKYFLQKEPPIHPQIRPDPDSIRSPAMDSICRI